MGVFYAPSNMGSHEEAPVGYPFMPNKDGQ